MQTNTRETVLEGFLVKILQLCSIIHAVKGTFPLRRGIGDIGCGYETGVATIPGPVFHNAQPQASRALACRNNRSCVCPQSTRRLRQRRGGPAFANAISQRT